MPRDYMAGFLGMRDAAFRGYGASDGLPQRFRDAVAATPRHLFVHRFRLRSAPAPNRNDQDALRDNDADPVGALEDIYSDAVMTHVDATGEKLPSTNSQPSYVLWLLHLLDLRPGHRVLEIGSGSGWLAAVMARLVGETGRVTGIEIIPELAAQSRADLARLGVRNVTVLATDGAQGHQAGAPFDRVMITAASWALPTALFDQVIEGGRVLLPVELRGGGCQVTVLRREGESFISERSVAGWFVPLLGSEQQRPRLRFALSELPFWVEIGGADPRRVKLPLATAQAAFRAFLGRTEPHFAVFGADEPAEWRSGVPIEPFGIMLEAERSVALWSSGELLGYGSDTAMRLLARAFLSWTSLGMPGLAGLRLRVVPADAAAAGTEASWVEKRNGIALIWSPAPDAKDWEGAIGSRLRLSPCQASPCQASPCQARLPFLIFRCMLTDRRSIAMRRSSAVLAAVAALSLALSPGLAQARAGGGGSFGSRGGHTWSAPPATRTAPYSAAPMQRSVTPSAPSRDYGSGYGYRPGFGSGFGSGLLGGLIGVGLGSMLFGHGGFGFFGLFGLLIRIAIIVLIVRWLFRWFRRSSPALAGGPNFFARSSQPGPRPMPMGGAASPPGEATGVAIGADDFAAFEQTLYAVQDAWSRRDLQRLQTLATPEMVGYFNEQLSDQASRGTQNVVSDVRLLQGDLAQAWAEQGREYATVAMRFSMIDVTRDMAGRIVDGNPAEHVTATELWTFVRAPGGRWVLSAIQQAR